MSRWLAAGLLIALVFGASPVVAATKEDLQALVKAGTSDRIIVDLLRAEGARFEFDAGFIIALKEQGAGENLLLALLDNFNATQQLKAGVAEVLAMQKAGVPERVIHAMVLETLRSKQAEKQQKAQLVVVNETAGPLYLSVHTSGGVMVLSNEWLAVAAMLRPGEAEFFSADAAIVKVRWERSEIVKELAFPAEGQLRVALRQELQEQDRKFSLLLEARHEGAVLWSLPVETLAAPGGKLPLPSTDLIGSFHRDGYDFAQRFSTQLQPVRPRTNRAHYYDSYYPLYTRRYDPGDAYWNYQYGGYYRVYRDGSYEYGWPAFAAPFSFDTLDYYTYGQPAVVIQSDASEQK